MIHPTALIGEPPQMRDWTPERRQWPVKLAENVRVGAYTCIDSGYTTHTRIGAHTWVMKQVHVGHDSQIGERVTIASGSVLGGYVHIGDQSKIGLNCTILPFVKIGRDCNIGAGSVVTKDVPDGEQWAGNPARPLPRKTDTTIARKFDAHSEYLEQFDHARRSA